MLFIDLILNKDVEKKVIHGNIFHSTPLVGGHNLPDSDDVVGVTGK